MNTKLRYFIICIIFFLPACAQNGADSFQVNILPEACLIKTGEQIALTLDGKIPSNTKVQWDAQFGEIVWTGQGLTAMYHAPSEPGEDSITVSFVSSTPMPSSTIRVCTVTTETPPPPAAAPQSVPPDTATIIISEVMGNPCGDLESKKFNQYIELHNYGSTAVDVGGWWIYDEGEQGTPDRLSAWDARSTTKLDPALITSSTFIPPHGFAVVLSPIYAESWVVERMPYQFPAGTVILTAAASQTLGDDFFGIIASEDGRDTLTLYIGGMAVMDQVVDTYGTPLISDSYPTHIDDDRRDHLPFYLHECESAERIDPLLPDAESNWSTIKGGSPGEGPYK